MTWDHIREVNFFILFVSFVIMVYKGVFFLTLIHRSFNWDRAMNMVWTVIAWYSTGEVLYLDTNGGPRIILYLIAALLQLWVVVFRFQQGEAAKKTESDHRGKK